MAFKKGDKKPPSSGRAKGTTNKKTAELQMFVFNALHAEEGAEAFFIRQKHDNPVAFMTLLGKFVPKDLNLNGDAILNVIIRKPE